ncbi:hydrolase [Mycobacterium sp. GA-1199]|uniref:adenylate/guanylate cyclase domain-containing protein n=1 Tax=Mycobacterium sp. GA-1199 TaxID=1772287 RepID=UPI000746E140|nr:adenylate/guanylate cyclase domain-containing protein [Mycobacterium sp. GA-1199]KUI47286.1 hydrolase [Mycobacterium sp. GA-1199]
MADGRVQYARNGDVRLAYRVFGESGPVIVWSAGWAVTNVDSFDEPGSPYMRIIDIVSPSCQFVVWDRRGTGLSDPAGDILTFDERVDDLRAVIDALGADRPVLVGSTEGGSISIIFAARYPERVSLLALYATAARFSQDLPDFPWGFTPAQIKAQLDEIDAHWGEGALAELFYGPAAETPGVRQMFGKMQRSTASPSMARLRWRAFVDIDVRGVLDSVRTPTLVVARPDDRFVSIEAAQALASGIPNARFHALPAGAHSGFDVLDELCGAILSFIGHSPSGPADARLLKTVMFTDIVGSTETLSRQGDTRWRHRLDIHDSVTDHVTAAHGGIRANHTGDGVFLLFDSPSRAARCALELVPALASRGIPIRVGLHTGECERRGQEWSGLAVHTGARIEAMAATGEILASRTVRDLSAGSGLRFESLGLHRLKGLPEDTEVFRVAAPD